MRLQVGLCWILVAGCHGSPVPASSGEEPRGLGSTLPPAPRLGGDDAGAQPSAVEVAPAELACIERYYGGQTVLDGTGWLLRLPTNEELHWPRCPACSPGGERTAEERIREPQLADTFAWASRRRKTRQE